MPEEGGLEAKADALHPVSRDAALRLLELHRERLHRYQDMRWEWLKLFSVSSFAFFAWAFANIDTLSTITHYKLIFSIPLLLNIVGVIVSISLQKTVNLRAKYLEQIEEKYLDEDIAWEKFFNERAGSRTIFSPLRASNYMCWLLMILISIGFMVMIGLEDGNWPSP